MLDEMPADRQENLTREDVLLLKEIIQKRLVIWVGIGCLLAAIALTNVIPFFDVGHWLPYFLLWLGITLFNFFEIYMAIRHNRKSVVRGVISARYERDPPTRRHNQAHYFFHINGREVGVTRAVYKKYLTRDFAEFHYIGKIFLKERLLKRGE